MFKSIQWRIALPFIALILVSLGGLGVYLATSVRDTLVDDIRIRLEGEARLTAEASLPLFTRGGDLDSLSENLGQKINARVTIIAADGTVLGDSLEDPASMENHSNRPEVIAALDTGLGESTRYSTTLSQQMMYVAVPVSDGARVFGVTRVALALTKVESLVSRVITTIILAMVITGLLAVLAVWLLARATTRPIRELTRATQNLAAGQFGEKIKIQSADEIGQLTQSFNEMSTNLGQTMNALSAEKSRLSILLMNIADGVIMTDSESTVLFSNTAAEKLFGFIGAKAAGRSLIEVVHDHEVDALAKQSLKTAAEQSVQFESSLNKRFVRAIAVPLSGARLNGILLLFQDLTELKNLQTMRRELIANISHELRTPIAGIKAMVETLQGGALEDRAVAKDFLSRVSQEVERLIQTVSEITELSRIESGKAGLEIEPLNLNLVIGEVIAQMSPLAQRQQVTLNTVLASTLPMIKGDKSRLRQVIVNLVHNAIKFNRPGGKVTVSTKAAEQSVDVMVSDNGIGISVEDLPHVFERFYKADKARTRGGSGLGLAIAKHTIQAHGGSIRADSQEGKGSIFKFSLPV